MSPLMEKQSNRRLRILVVDDELALTRLLKLNLEGNGHYFVREENRGAHALAAAREFKPDVIVLDIIMPDISGGNVAAQLKADPALKRTPIIFLTALISPEQAKQANQSSDDHYLAKPSTLEELMDSIRGKLDAKDLEPYASLAKPFSVVELLLCVGQCLQDTRP